MRLDQAVAARYPDVSRRNARELIAARRVLVNDRVVGISSREVAESDRVTLINAVPDIAVIAEQQDWIAVDKPAAMPTTPPEDRKLRSLEELLRIRFRELYVVHRIDTNTTGLVVFAKSRAAAAKLSALFAQGAIRKWYLGVAHGEIASEVTISSPVGGKSALTIVRPLAAADNLTLVEAEIRTGRMHQIRIHLRSIGHPIMGDPRYGAPPSAAGRPMLHAWRLEHELLGRLEAPLPDDLIRCAPPWKPTT
ncbi:MAG: pseudouridine synthase [Acidobacteriota bacterium]